MSVACVAVAAAAAEPTRRALDAAGLLDVSRRAVQLPDRQVALPLLVTRAAAEEQWGADLSRLAPAPPLPSLPSLPSLPTPPTLSLVELPATRLPLRGPRAALEARVAAALAACGACAGSSAALLAALPAAWEKLGDVVLCRPSPAFAEALARLSDAQRDAALGALALALRASRVGVQGRVEASLRRKSGAELLYPADAAGWTVHTEQRIVYGLDVRRSMFSSGNGSEKARVGGWDCSAEVVADLYAGIGYFSLPYLVHARAKHLHACEWDDDALAALRYNLEANGVAARCTVHAGDNARSVEHFAAAADRVNLGLIPSSEAGWQVGVRALRAEGGLGDYAREIGRDWRIDCKHVERVKWYAPRVRHVVVDVLCRPRDAAAPPTHETEVQDSQPPED
ncbi:hypothetical protein AB1Y20_003526 [Prymnesium parvum]|uniref:tRNA(Phe) (4-demethylwyosine(37)-C(7)) aminocarboxypropyltransferase n=1 Tax=Prymnesium parvum TaxID=97485 RepID=A0AB34J7C3_PRYPA